LLLGWAAEVKDFVDHADGYLKVSVTVCFGVVH
jgi:hypothetical protein